jgi:hypothetical protein
MGRLVARGNYHAPAVSPRCARRFGGDGCLNLGGRRYTGVLLAAGEQTEVSGCLVLSVMSCVCSWDLRKCSMPNALRRRTGRVKGRFPKLSAFSPNNLQWQDLHAFVLYLGDSAVAPARPFTMFSRLSRQTRDEETRGLRHDGHPLESLSRQR